MKKFALALCLFGMAMTSPGWSEPKESLSRAYVQQCNNLKNTAVALEMWACDNQGEYPDSLQRLVPNYLKGLLPGPQGRTDEMVYSRDSSGKAYSLTIQGSSFVGLKVGESYPRYTSDKGLDLNGGGGKPDLILPLLKPTLDSSWDDRSNGLSNLWVRNHSTIRSILYTDPYGDTARLERQFLHLGEQSRIESELTVNGQRWALELGERKRRPQDSQSIRFAELRCLEQGGYVKVLSYETDDEVVAPEVLAAFKTLMPRN